MNWQKLSEQISQASGDKFIVTNSSNMSGGDINHAVRLTDGNSNWFVKLNRADMLYMFEAESEGLAAMADTNSIRVPKPLCTGVLDGQSYIVMESLAMGRSGAKGHSLAGEQLAEMHRSSSGTFGWHRDNTIGATHQPNKPASSWIEFWRDQRLGFQLELGARHGYGRQLQSTGDKLLGSFHQLIDHDPQPSLIHGDLWGGNLSFDENGQPVIYDPATYYGDREADLAMTELFGGFGSSFYAAYQEAWPLDSGYAARKTLYNLYHILNHLNMFGGGYLGQAMGMMERLLAEL